MNVKQLIEELRYHDPELLVTSVFNGVEEEVTEVATIEHGTGDLLRWYNSSNEEKIETPRVRID